MVQKSIWLLILSFLLVACAAPAALEPTSASAVAPVTVTDGLNRSVTLAAGAAQRVVSLAPSNTEILFAVGAGSQLVGRDEFSNYPAEALDIPSVGGSMGNYNAETIVSLKPDLVLAAEINPPELVENLAGLGLTVYLLPNPTDIEGVYANLLTVAQLTGHTAEAETLVASLRQRVQAVQEKIAPLSYAPVVFYELDATDPNAPYTTGPGTFMHLLLGMAGGINAASGAPNAWAQFSTEELLVQNPQVILLGDAAYGVTIEAVQVLGGHGYIREYPVELWMRNGRGIATFNGLAMV